MALNKTTSVMPSKMVGIQESKVLLYSFHQFCEGKEPITTDLLKKNTRGNTRHFAHIANSNGVIPSRSKKYLTSHFNIEQ